MCCSSASSDIMIPSIYVVILLYTAGITGEGLHSLWIFATHISGQTPFPEFSAVLMLDDVQVGYYDSNSLRFIYHKHGGQELDEVAQNELGMAFGDTFYSMKKRTSLATNRFNSTNGLIVQQRITGCELLDDQKRGHIMIKEAFNGVEGGTLDFHNQQYNYHPEWPELVFNRLRKQTVQSLLQNVYLPICVKFLHLFLEQKKNIVRRIERPRVRVIQRANEDGGLAQVGCLATGFYPRFINLTLLRDGQPVAEDRLIEGPVLPNMDGTYQVRRTMEVSAQELGKRHHYTCTTSHLSLDNKLDVSWESESDPDNVSIIIVILAVVIPILIISSVVIVMWRRKCFASSQPKYSAARETESRSSTSVSEASIDPGF